MFLRPNPDPSTTVDMSHMSQNGGAQALSQREEAMGGDEHRLCGTAVEVTGFSEGGGADREKKKKEQRETQSG